MATCAKWGSIRWGAAKWGEDCTDDPPEYAKPDTRLLLDGTTSVTADESQRATNLTASGSGSYEAPSARLAVASPRTIDILADLSTAVDGRLVHHGDTGGTLVGYAIRMDGGELVCEDSRNGEIFRVTPPNIDGTAGAYVIAWATEANDLATGASDAYVSELAVYDVAGGAWLIEQATHRAPPVAVGHSFAVRGRWNGATLSDTYSGDVDTVRIGVRFHSTTETAEDFVAQSTPTSPDATHVLEPPPFPREMAGEGHIAGPVYAYAASAHRQASLRMVSPLAEFLALDPPTLEDDLADVFPASWIITPPQAGIAGWQTCLAYCWWCPLPPHVGHVRPHIHAQLWATSGSPDSLGVRVYSSSRRPGILPIGLVGAPPPPPRKDFYVEASRSTNDTATGAGGFLDFSSPLKIAREPNADGTWLYLATRIEAASSPTTRYRIKAASFDPLAVANPLGGGLNTTLGTLSP